MQFKILDKQRAYDGFLKIDKYTVEHDAFEARKGVNPRIERSDKRPLKWPQRRILS